jgi:hypothetical protein
MSNKFDQKWSQLSKADQTAMKDKYDNKQGWQDAKARSQGFTNEQERRGNTGERHLKNNPGYVAPSTPPPKTETATSKNTAPTSNSGTQLSDSSGLYQDRYMVGYHGDDDKGKTFVGSDHSENFVNELKLTTTGDPVSYGDKYRQKADEYISDNGYAGDVLKHIDRNYKDLLTNPIDINWYNSVVDKAKSFDWEKENASKAGDSGSYYDVRAGGRAANQTDEVQAQYKANNWYNPGSAYTSATEAMKQVNARKAGEDYNPQALQYLNPDGSYSPRYNK